MQWLSFLNGKKENPCFTKLKRVLPESVKIKSVKCIFYIGGFIYSENNFDEAKNAVLSNRLDTFLKRVGYDTQNDNVEIYVLEDMIGKRNVIFVFDPFELYSKERILEIIPINEQLIASHSEKIYSLE